VDKNSGFAIAPAICYESIYGDFMTGFFRNKANLMVIITNDGWWGNTAGHKQHLAYGRLRAIESRRWVVRSANTGISAFIDPFGTIVQQQEWDTAATLKQEIQPMEKQTFFVRFGDWISWIMIIGAILLLSWSSLVYVSRRKNSKPIN
jgi:apolipoprotein N-acyltransferase